MKVLVIVCISVLVLQNVDARPKKIEQMYMERKSVSDLDSSASGYIYQQNGHAPASYVNLGSALGGHGANYGYAAPVSTGHYIQHTPQYLPQYVIKPQPVAYVPVQPVVQPKVELENYGNVGQLSPLPLETPEQYYNEQIQEEAEKENGALGNLNNGKSEIQATGYEKGEGEKYNEAQHAAKGEKGEEGYKNNHHYEKGAQGKHDKEGHKGFYNDVNGKKSSHNDEGAHYGQHHVAAKGSEGASFHESKGHKKGSKTTGFHNVYHKDEYKKDHSFYDESDNNGHYEKHGEEGAHHSNAEGGYKKGGNADAGFHKENYGKKGFHYKGHYLNADKGFKGAQGDESYYNDEENYRKKDGSNEGKAYGYSEGDSVGKYH